MYSCGVSKLGINILCKALHFQCLSSHIKYPPNNDKTRNNEIYTINFLCAEVKLSDTDNVAFFPCGFALAVALELLCLQSCTLGNSQLQRSEAMNDYALYIKFTVVKETRNKVV
jgi:hypothetical protein